MKQVSSEREKKIVETSLIGIGVNAILVVFKLFVGFVTSSIAITLDGINNLSDALSSVITIVGTKLSAKRPDKKHPLGYGRSEYLTSIIVSALVLYAGITSIVESVQAILHTQHASYSTLSLVILIIGVFVKFVLGIFVRQRGKEVDSASLVASGSDALFDAILSFSVFVSAIVFIVFHVSLEAIVGFVISLFIVKSGFELLKDTLDDLVGKRTDQTLIDQIKSVIGKEKEVHGVYDLFVNDYGPDRNYASVHIEVNENFTAEAIDRLSRRLQEIVYKETGIILTAVGIYSQNEAGSRQSSLQNEIEEVVLEFPWAIQMHGFYADFDRSEIRFDVVINFDIGQKEAMAVLQDTLSKKYPMYTFMIVIDIDISD